jgi:hypothetical protein
MSSQPVPVHPQERVIRGQLGEPRRRGYTQNNKVRESKKRRECVTKRPRGAQPTPCSPRDPIHVPP